MNIRRISLTLLALPLCQGMSSCRLALHTLPDYVGKKEFEVYEAKAPGYEVYSCEGVLYVKLPGYYVRPRVALFESYDLKDGDWENAFGRGYTSRPHVEELTLYLPLDKELVRKWNGWQDKPESYLRFERYESGVQTEAQMREKQGKLIAHGKITGGLETAICEAATHRNFAHYALRPIAIPLEMVDTISTIPLSAASCATALIVGPTVTLVYDIGRQMRRQDAPDNLYHQPVEQEKASDEPKKSE